MRYHFDNSRMKKWERVSKEGRMVKPIKEKRDFSSVFNDSISEVNKKRKDYLSDYLGHNPADSYMEQLYKKFLRGENIADTEGERVDELMQNVDLDVLFVNSLLAPEGKTLEDLSKPGLNLDYKPQIVDRIEKVMDWGKGRLKGWNAQFIFGDDGAALLNQCVGRGGWLSPKQLKQLDRIEKILGL